MDTKQVGRTSMNKCSSTLGCLWSDEDGLTVVEYAIAGGLIGATVIAAFQLLGGTVAGIINYIQGQLATAPGG
jgi:pilus assembly protein Flp/PilA